MAWFTLSGPLYFVDRGGGPERSKMNKWTVPYSLIKDKCSGKKEENKYWLILKLYLGVSTKLLGPQSFNPVSENSKKTVKEWVSGGKRAWKAFPGMFPTIAMTVGGRRWCYPRMPGEMWSDGLAGPGLVQGGGRSLIRWASLSWVWPGAGRGPIPDKMGQLIVGLLPPHNLIHRTLLL